MDESEPKQPPMRNLRPALEVQEAHDILISIIMGELKIGLDPGDPGLRGAADVLCWVLGHDHNPAFAGNLAKIKAAMQRLGYVTLDAGRPMARQEFQNIYRRKQ